MLADTYKALEEKLKRFIESARVVTNPLLLLAYGTDASFYRLIPKIVVRVHSEEEAIQVIKLTTEMNIPLTYRSAGTSLSGQAVSDSVLMIATHHWQRHEILSNGDKVKLQPGIVGGRANLLLTPYGRKIGPDPGSINSAMIGGIAANNASGMCCGTAKNSYNTIADIRIILHDGTVLDTADARSKELFEKTHGDMLTAIEKLRDDIAADQALTERIKHKFKIKNTTGYSINAFVDYHAPFDIITHIMIGSEGTLGFISDITYNTVINYKYKACSLIVFDNIELACEAVPLLRQSPVEAVELLDRNSIRSVEEDKEAPDYFRELPEEACILLVECQADDDTEMTQKQEEAREAISSIPTLKDWAFTSDQKRYAFNWRVRNGLLPSVGSMRKTGTSCIIEDVAFPVPRLAEASRALLALFKKYHYTDAVLFGHALEGNLHLVFSQNFNEESEVKRYAALMNELSDIVVDQFDGSLKAEHGTGRNMAPFVEKEWGKAAYTMMKRIKAIFDPNNLINPGVLLNDNTHVHLENLKPSPATNEIVDKCMECGYCEPVCVSEGLTLSPRHRIVVGREISRLKASGESPERLEQFIKDEQYFSDETCATDGLCAMSCPVKIDTGKYIKDIRYGKITESGHRNAQYLANNLDRITSVGRIALDGVGLAHSVLGDSLMGGIAQAMRSVSGNRIPLWTKSMPRGGKKIKHTAANPNQELKVVYFPSCINRSMGKSKDYDKGDIELTQKTEELLVRAGYTIIYPEALDNLCCGMAFSSKGYKEEGSQKAKELEASLIKTSEDGKYPILFDMSPCFYTYIDAHKNDNLKLYDPVEFMLEHVMPKLEVKHKRESIAVFPVCSVKKIGMEYKLLELAKQCADEVTLVQTNCCGFAGDRGFNYPELMEHGHRHLKEQIPSNCSGGFSTSRTCEIGMTEYSDLSFKSIFYLIDEVTK